MDIYRPICKHVVIPLWAKWEQSPYLDHLHYLQKSQYFSVDQTKEIQWQKMTRLIRHAYDNCTYYKDRFDSEHIHPHDIKTFDDFALLPLLTKENVYTHSQGMMARNINKYIKFLTSGSTGKPLSGFRDKDCSEFKRACGRRSEFWAGYTLGERIYCLYGNPEEELKGIRKLKAKLRRKYLYRTEILDMLRLDEASMLAFANKMRRKPPSLLWGHAHGLYLLATFLEKEGINTIKPKGMFSAGMVLHDFERKKVEDVFHCKLQDRYGTEELGLIATECKEQQGLHINTDCHYVEFIANDGKPVSPGERGFIIVTDMTNMAMPFIRYKLEDVCIPSAKQCTCGRTQPLIERIEGRVADFLITPEGMLVSGISLTDHFAGHIPGVAEIQIVQQESDLLILNIVKGHEFGPDSDKAVERLVKEFFGPRMQYRYEFLEHIPQGSTGKHRFTICKIKHNLL